MIIDDLFNFFINMLSKIGANNLLSNILKKILKLPIRHLRRRCIQKNTCLTVIIFLLRPLCNQIPNLAHLPSCNNFHHLLTKIRPIR